MHFHYTMGISAVFAVIGGYYFWSPKILGLYFNEKLGQIQFWLLFIGVNVTFLPQHFLGLQGMPRRYPNYPDAFYGWNLISSFGSIISLIATVLLLYIIYDQLVYGIENKFNGKAVTELNEPDFTESNAIFNTYNSNRNISLEWASENPAPLHTYNTPVIQ